jgi:predicted phosphodiesterase
VWAIKRTASEAKPFSLALSEYMTDDDTALICLTLRLLSRRAWCLKVVPWGDQMSLAQMQRQLDVDILVSGHTHKNEVNEYEGKWFINPGSVTGSYSALDSDVTPSFILLAVQGNKVVTYVYELKNDKVEVSKSEFQKK